MPYHRLGLIVALVGLVTALPSTAMAKNATLDTPKRVATALKRGLSKGEGVGEAFKRAAALKGKFTDKELKPVVTALGRAFKQNVKNYKLLALKALAALHVDGSYGQFAKLLKIGGFTLEAQRALSG